jgi:hypothetical protein
LGVLVTDEGGEEPGVGEGEPVVLVMVAEVLRGIWGEWQRIWKIEEAGEEGALSVEAQIDMVPEFRAIVWQVSVTVGEGINGEQWRIEVTRREEVSTALVGVTLEGPACEQTFEGLPGMTEVTQQMVRRKSC